MFCLEKEKFICIEREKRTHAAEIAVASQKKKKKKSCKFKNKTNLSRKGDMCHRYV